jgi:hypothetical protein
LQQFLEILVVGVLGFFKDNSVISFDFNENKVQKYFEVELNDFLVVFVFVFETL